MHDTAQYSSIGFVEYFMIHKIASSISFTDYSRINNYTVSDSKILQSPREYFTNITFQSFIAISASHPIHTYTFGVQRSGGINLHQLCISTFEIFSRLCHYKGGFWKWIINGFKHFLQSGIMTRKKHVKKSILLPLKDFKME